MRSIGSGFILWSWYEISGMVVTIYACSCIATYLKQEFEQQHQDGEKLEFVAGRHSQLYQLDPALQRTVKDPPGL